MTEERAAMIRYARSFLGVQYVHAGRSRRGVDCAGLVLLARTAALSTPGDFRAYGDPPTVREIADGARRYLDLIQNRDAGPGDVAFLRYSGEPSHFGILTDKGTVIHASPISRKVVETRTNDIARTYRIRGVAPWRA